MNKRPWTWVDTTVKRRQAEKDMQASSILCIDTEYDSFRYFHDKLCLIQIKAEEKSYLFDPLNGVDLSFLAEPFADPAMLKVLHAGDNDIRLLKRDYGFAFSNVFDTHRAAAILGCHYLSLSTLIKQFLDIDLEKKKKIQRSQWDIRPLSEEQLRYAVLDTAYLKPLYEILAAEIRTRGLEKEAAHAFAEITTATWQEKVFDVRGHTRIKAYPILTAAQKKRIQRLYRWRFQKARELNRAIFMILSEQDLVNLVRMETLTPAGLKNEGGFSAERAARFGEEILSVMM
ncbi:MAG: ribonuclease D [Deltaproteobacteria bacterium]|nr:ribonuclease D [Deltaproteobacteria bacterium]